MSAKLELVRSICSNWQRGDYSSIEWAHPQIEFEIADGIEPGRWTGPAGMAEGWRPRLSAWEEVRVEPIEYRELDAERVLVLYRGRGRGKTSGLDLGKLRTSGAMVFHVRDGKVTRLVVYNDAAFGLADLGLSAKPDPSRP